MTTTTVIDLTGQLQRNRHQIRVNPSNDREIPENLDRETNEPIDKTTEGRCIMTRSQIGTEIRPLSFYLKRGDVVLVDCDLIIVM